MGMPARALRFDQEDYMLLHSFDAAFGLAQALITEGCCTDILPPRQDLLAHLPYFPTDDRQRNWSRPQLAWNPTAFRTSGAFDTLYAQLGGCGDIVVIPAPNEPHYEEDLDLLLNFIYYTDKPSDGSPDDVRDWAQRQYAQHGPVWPGLHMSELARVTPPVGWQRPPPVWVV